MNREDLHGYQETAVEHLMDNPFSALFLEMGLGKTVSTLTAVNTLIYEHLECSTALVIGPKRVVESVWASEAQKWDHLRHLKVSKIIGDVKKRKKALREKADIYLISRDNIAWLCGQFGGSMLPYDICVIDELSSFKNPKSIRFKALRNVQPSFSRVIGLTGTPAPNGLIDLWSQIYLLDRGERLGKYLTRYREDYFDAGAKNGHVVYKYILKQGGEEAIHAKISDICMSMKATDYLDMPELIVNPIEIYFPADLQKRYDDFEREQVLSLFEGQPIEEGISVLSAAALSNKLLQFANGAVYDEDKNWHEVHDLKIEAVKELVEDSTGPILIAWTYRHDKERLDKALKKYSPRHLKDDQDILDWNEGKIKVLMMHPASGGHGLNLQAGGNTIVWFGQTWSLELYQQLNARLYRQGQTQKGVIIHKLVCLKTMDCDVLASQKTKGEKQDDLMKAVKAKIKKYLT